MKIKQEIIDQINNPYDRTKIALALKQGEQSVAIMCRHNNEDGPLTKASALKAIREITGLKKDTEILEEETEPVKNRA